MTPTDKTFNLQELAALAAVPPRTVRYYIQIGLVEPPEGETRAATYHRRHLEKLLEIRRYQEAGLSLERIGELLAGKAGELPVPVRSRYAGSVEVWSHITLADGVELHIEPGRARLAPEQVRRLAKEAMRALENLKKENEK